jgi:transcriptional repressor NrdR
MRCPFCAHDDSQVKDSVPPKTTPRSVVAASASCGARFTTFERVQLREIVVVKSGPP